MCVDADEHVQQKGDTPNIPQNSHSPQSKVPPDIHRGGFRNSGYLIGAPEDQGLLPFGESILGPPTGSPTIVNSHIPGL